MATRSQQLQIWFRLSLPAVFVLAQDQINGFLNFTANQTKATFSGSFLNPFRNLRAGGNVPGPDPNVDSEFNSLLRRENPGYSALQPTPAFNSQNQGPNRILRARQVGTWPTCDNGDFEFGNIPRVTGEIRNYLYQNEDFSFLKRTPIGENVGFIFKMELLNAFNRHVFSTPNLNPYDNFFGVPTGTIDGPRHMQLTARIEF